MGRATILSKISTFILTGGRRTTASGTRDVLIEMANNYVACIYDTATNFTTSNPILETKQHGVETDGLTTAPKFKIGDGVTAWNSLPYANAGTGLSGLTTNTIPKATSSDTIVDSNITDNGTNVNINSETSINGSFNAISNDGNSSIVVEDGDVISQWTNGPIYSFQSNDANESSLNFYNVGVGYTAFIKAKEFSNDIFHSVKNVFNSPINEFTNGGAYFVSGIGIDTTATAGIDILNIGATNANVINYGNASTIHNFLGTAIYELQVNSYVTDKLITLNHGGSVASGIGVGFEIEEAGGITGFLKTNATRDGFSFQAPSIVHTAHFLFSSFTSDRTFDLPDSSGTLALESFVDSKVADSITDGITTVAPSQNAVFDALLTKANLTTPMIVFSPIKLNTTISHTGTTNETKLYSVLIPAGTMKANDILEYYALAIPGTGSGNRTLKVYLNTSNAIGGIQIATYTFTTTSNIFKRKLTFKNSLSTQEIIPAGVTSMGNFELSTYASSNVSSIAANFNNDVWFVISMTLSTASDNVSIYSIGSNILR